MDERASGIILRTRPLTETSLIVHWLTHGHGRVATVAKGARRPKSAFRGKLDIFYQADFSFQRSRRSELHNLHEVSLRETHAALRSDIGRVQQAAYAVALIEQTTETETPLDEVYDLMLGFVQHLAMNGAKPANVLAFELKLLELLGQSPQPEEIKMGRSAQALMAALQDCEWAQLAEAELTVQHISELRQFLHGFLIYHLDRIPRGRNAAIEA
ncbi:MAG TPA: DNA repair protein RecO [Verrucomicrobiae bacterium]